MHQNSPLALGTWVAIGLSTWTIAWIIAESIPVFNDLLSLIVCCSISLFLRYSLLTTSFRVPCSEVGLAVSLKSPVSFPP